MPPGELIHGDNLVGEASIVVKKTFAPWVGCPELLGRGDRPGYSAIRGAS
jgi:hypothetical protein